MITFDGDVVTPADWNADLEIVSPVSDHSSFDYEFGSSKSVKKCFIESKDGKFCL